MEGVSTACSLDSHDDILPGGSLLPPSSSSLCSLIIPPSICVHLPLLINSRFPHHNRSFSFSVSCLEEEKSSAFIFGFVFFIFFLHLYFGRMPFWSFSCFFTSSSSSTSAFLFSVSAGAVFFPPRYLSPWPRTLQRSRPCWSHLASQRRRRRVAEEGRDPGARSTVWFLFALPQPICWPKPSIPTPQHHSQSFRQSCLLIAWKEWPPAFTLLELSDFGVGCTSSWFWREMQNPSWSVWLHPGCLAWLWLSGFSVHSAINQHRCIIVSCRQRSPHTDWPRFQGFCHVVRSICLVCAWSDKRTCPYFAFQTWLRRQKKAPKRFDCFDESSHAQKRLYFLLCAFELKQRGDNIKKVEHLSFAAVRQKIGPTCWKAVLLGNSVLDWNWLWDFFEWAVWQRVWQVVWGLYIMPEAASGHRFGLGSSHLVSVFWLWRWYKLTSFTHRTHWCDIFSLWNLRVDPTITPNLSESSKSHCDDTLESPATLAPERDPSSPSPCQTLPPSPPSSPPPSPPPIPALAPHLPLPAVHRVLEDGEGTSEERAQAQASPDSYCRVMGLLGMGHRLFVPRLLAVRKWGLELEISFHKIL